MDVNDSSLEVVRDFSVEEAVHVGSEIELRTAINNTAPNIPLTIALDKDVRLTKGALIVGVDQIIILISGGEVVGGCKLFGVEGVSTIVVEGNGTLKLDGVVVTHTKPGRGVYVEESGCLILYSGEITGNTIYVREVSGGGVYNLGVFEMYGGKISKNYVSNYSLISGYGGGVYNNGTFTMYGGEITNNTAIMHGGGVYNTYCGTFTMFDGKIADNDGGHLGGGIYNAGTFNKFGGNISGNIAAEGNNVYPIENNDDGLPKAIVCAGVVVIAVGVVSLFLYFKRYKNKP